MSVANVSTFEQIRKFLTNNGLEWLARNCFRRSLGVALSGGADSVALLLIAVRMGWRPIALHCNFRLRGEESMRDETFVMELCRRLGVELHIVRFNVAQRIEQTGESVEMACRSLRYDWFERMARELNLQAVALGHHRDDNVETFMLNALRGSGIAGVKGIPVSRDIYVRPLLSLSRADILDFLKSEGESYVTDSTNNENLFQRNKIRNELMPVAEQLFPGASRKIAQTVGMLNSDYQLFRSLIDEKRQKYVSTDGVINISLLMSQEPLALTLLFHLLNGAIDMERLRLLTEQATSSGKRYFTNSGDEYLLDRGKLIPIKKEPEEATIKITQRLIPREEFRPMRNPAYAWFDADKLGDTANLQLRHPRLGDAIQPFGMAGRQLLSDIFSDKKLSLIEKRRQWVVTLNDEILWIPGLRNSGLYPVTDSTVNILELHAVDFAKK